jgi:hypothetical protein
MAQSKTLLFLGRQDSDTGYMECVQIAKDNKWKLVTVENSLNPISEIQAADCVFAGGYLVALEAFANKKIVVAAYDNPIKKDYWLMHPMAKHIGFNGHVPEKYSSEAYEWARLQSWERLARSYENLWLK